MCELIHATRSSTLTRAALISAVSTISTAGTGHSSQWEAGPALKMLRKDLGLFYASFTPSRIRWFWEKRCDGTGDQRESALNPRSVVILGALRCLDSEHRHQVVLANQNRKESTMWDVFYVAVAIVFFVACWYLTRACEKL